MKKLILLTLTISTLSCTNNNQKVSNDTLDSLKQYSAKCKRYTDSLLKVQADETEFKNALNGSTEI